MQASRGYMLRAAMIAAAALAVRIAYVLAQPATDPWFASPALDGAVYLDTARNLAAGLGGPEGAFYLAPGYTWLLAIFLKGAGESFGMLYLLQQVLSVGAGCLLAEVARRSAGENAGLFTFLLAVTYQPLLFFASRPLGEVPAIFLLCAALAAYSGNRPRRYLLAGVLLGAAILIRPNFLLVALAWIGLELAGRRWRQALVLCACTAALILPVTIRNYAVSSHLVPVSSNAGMTLYHGNGPGAEGVFTTPERFSGRPETQRREALALAREATGDMTMDAVEADRWWGRSAVRTRLESPGESTILLARRAILTVSNRELGLDYHPGLDRNRWRVLAPVPFALLLGLAFAGWVLAGLRRSGGGETGSALVALCLTPLIFYVSSRYRLPVAFLLVVPAGAGAALLLESGKRLQALVCIAVVTLLSLLAPDFGLDRNLQAGALGNRAIAWSHHGLMEPALVDVAAAVEADDSSSVVWFQAGTVYEKAGNDAEALKAYSRSLELDSTRVVAAGNLAGQLLRLGKAGEAIPILVDALAVDSGNKVCWTNLVVAHASLGAMEDARSSAALAKSNGVTLDPGLLQAIREEGK